MKSRGAFAASEPERSDIDAFYQNERELLTGWMDIRGYVKTRLALPDAAGMCLRLREAGFDVDFCLTVDELAQEVAEKCL